ncbi:MAG: 3-hydroxylacyl-ACP dehydratase [Haliea sp.]|nr:3-hydroxylacyl-ACP dehydratase [Haliea sp.]
MNELPAIEKLVPHATPLLLLDTVVESGDDYLICELTVRSDGLFDTRGRVPAWLGIEYMAQTISAYSGLQSHQRGEPVKVGFLLGTRHFETNVADFACGDTLRVTVKKIVHASSGMGAFECTVEGHRTRQTATVAVYEPAERDNFKRAIR